MKKMCERVRAVAPRSRIIAGGFGTTLSEFSQTCEVDHICEGEGIRFMRDLLGLSPEFVFRHPDLSCEIIEILGVPIRPVAAAFGMLGPRRFQPDQQHYYHRARLHARLRFLLHLAFLRLPPPALLPLRRGDL